MSKHRMVDTAFWSDPWVVDNLNPLDRYLFLYFLTNDKTNVAGIYEISLKTISNETGLEKEELLRMLKRLESRVKYLDGYLILRNFIKSQNYHSPKIKTGVDLVLERVPPDLLDNINWPKDFGSEKPEGTLQTKLISMDVNAIETVEKRQSRYGKNDQSVVRSYNKGKKSVLQLSTTSTPVKYGIDTISHSKVLPHNSNSKAPALPPRPSQAVKKTVKSASGKGYKSAAAVADIIKKRSMKS